MLYYRTHASRAGEYPPELVGWVPPAPDVQLSENTVGEHRMVAVVPPFVFAPPVDGWVKLCAGWEVTNVGAFNPLAHARLVSKFQCVPTVVDEQTWLLPRVLTETGTRAFKVIYAGPTFTPQMTLQQSDALDLAREIRTCHEAGTLPDVSTRAQWVARLLPLTYCLSPASLGVVGLSEDLIAATLAVAGGWNAE